MRPTRRDYRQSTQKVKSHFALCVQQLFTAELHGYKMTNKLIINILTAALCYGESLFSVCLSLVGSPTDKTIADNLIKLLPSCQKLQQQINQTLARQLPNKFFNKAHRLAIDLVLIPYHGQHYTVAIIPVAKGTKMKEVVQVLLQQCRNAGLKIKLLLLDRGFYDVLTISYLKKCSSRF